jgi:putative transposase
MARSRREASGGHVYHVFNRGVRRQTLFDGSEEYADFLKLMMLAREHVAMRLLGYCLMPNHWHLVLWPEEDGAISAYIKWLAGTHACYFNGRHGLTGHVYQGRFRSVVVKDDRHLLTLLAYVESNPVRAGLVKRAEHWAWSSATPTSVLPINPSPCPRPDTWLELLAATPAEAADSDILVVQSR